MTRSLHPIMRLVTTALLLGFAVSDAFAKSEQDVKAAYLYNFIKFVEWPEPSNSGQHKLCVLGKDAINDKLGKLNARQVKGKTLQVVSLNSYEQIQDQECRILFVGQSEEKFLDDIFNQAPSNPTLTISSIEDFADAGGVIGFVKLGNVIRFNINLKKAKSSELSIRAKLLELANKVVQ